MKPAIGRPGPPETPTEWWMYIALVLFLVGLVALDATLHELVQGDWHCAFQHCVFVK